MVCCTIIRFGDHKPCHVEEKEKERDGDKAVDGFDACFDGCVGGGRNNGSNPRHARPKFGAVWAATAEYLDGRIQAAAAEKDTALEDEGPCAAWASIRR